MSISSTSTNTIIYIQLLVNFSTIDAVDNKLQKYILDTKFLAPLFLEGGGGHHKQDNKKKTNT